MLALNQIILGLNRLASVLFWILLGLNKIISLLNQIILGLNRRASSRLNSHIGAESIQIILGLKRVWSVQNWVILVRNQTKTVILGLKRVLPVQNQTILEILVRNQTESYWAWRESYRCKSVANQSCIMYDKGWEFIRFYWHQCHYQFCSSVRFFIDSQSVFRVEKKVGF